MKELLSGSKFPTSVGSGVAVELVGGVAVELVGGLVLVPLVIVGGGSPVEFVPGDCA